MEPKKRNVLIFRCAACVLFVFALVFNVGAFTEGGLKGDVKLSNLLTEASADGESGSAKYDWSWPTCTLLRTCPGKSEEEVAGIKLVCVSGNDYVNCSNGSCVANKACGF